VAVTAAVVAAVATGCGSDGDDGSNPSRSKVETSSASTTAEAARTTGDGTLRGDGGKVVRAWGPRDENRRVVVLLRQMQREFRAGRMAAVCEHIDPFLLEQFEPGVSEPHSKCSAKMTTYARELEAQGKAPLRAELLWVRSYGWEAGVWIEVPGGERLRVPFKDLDGTGWKLTLGAFPRPELLAGVLVER
jgi:hypothetical protein